MQREVLEGRGEHRFWGSAPECKDHGRGSVLDPLLGVELTASLAPAVTWEHPLLA